MKKLLLALFSVIIFSSACFGANEVYFSVKFKADKSTKDFTFQERYSFDGCCHLSVYLKDECYLYVLCTNAKQKEEAITKLKALADAIEKAGYGDCMLNKSELEEGSVMQGKYVYTEIVGTDDDFSNEVWVRMDFHSEKVDNIGLWNASSKDCKEDE